MSYKHGNWYCKPANEKEAREIVERAVACGAEPIRSENYESLQHYCIGVYEGAVDFSRCKLAADTDAATYTITQVRELFPLPGERTEGGKSSYAKQQYPLGTQVEVCMNGVWHPATIHGQAGDYIIARADGYWYDEYAAEDVRPLRTERERWVDQAYDLGPADDSGDFRAFAEMIYDALKSGTLKAPEVE